MERRTLAEDGRCKLIFLSRQGEELARQVQPLVDEVYGYAEAKVNGEAVAAAIAVLEEVYETLERY